MSNSAKASRAVFQAGREHYHFEMARREHGDKAVIDAMIVRLSNKSPKMAYSKVCIIAASNFENMNTLQSGGSIFKSLRAELDEAARVHNQIVFV